MEDRKLNYSRPIGGIVKEKRSTVDRLDKKIGLWLGSIENTIFSLIMKFSLLHSHMLPAKLEMGPPPTRTSKVWWWASITPTAVENSWQDGALNSHPNGHELDTLPMSPGDWQFIHKCSTALSKLDAMSYYSFCNIRLVIGYLHWIVQYEVCIYVKLEVASDSTQ